jgi:hypothetical protein
MGSTAGEFITALAADPRVLVIGGLAGEVDPISQALLDDRAIPYSPE